MYKCRKIIAVIPARGGSKGLPGKNIRPLAGKPLIGWTIEQALKSRLIDRVLVSTDDVTIAKKAKGFGADIPFMRPAWLAKDSSKIIDTLIYTLDQMEKRGESFDYLALLEPTSPLRRKNDIDDALRKLISNTHYADSIISVGEIALEHPVYAKKINPGGRISNYFKTGLSHALRQDVPPAFFPYGVIYASKVTAIRKLREVYGGRVIAHHIERWQNYEINDIYDFLCVESVMNAQEAVI